MAQIIALSCIFGKDTLISLDIIECKYAVGNLANIPRERDIERRVAKFLFVLCCSNKSKALGPVSLLQLPRLKLILLLPFPLQNYIKVTRMFVGEPVWTAHKRPAADDHPARAQYLKDLHAGKFPRE